MTYRYRREKQDRKTEKQLKRREDDRRFIEKMNDLCGLVGLLSGDDQGSDRHV